MKPDGLLRTQNNGLSHTVHPVIPDVAGFMEFGATDRL